MCCRSNVYQYSLTPTNLSCSLKFLIVFVGSKTSKENFRPVSKLTNVSKIFECILFQQCILILIVFSRSTSVVWDKGLVPSTVWEMDKG